MELNNTNITDTDGFITLTNIKINKMMYVTLDYSPTGEIFTFSRIHM